MGASEVRYAVVAAFAMGFGLVTPPFGGGFRFARLSPDVAIRYVWPPCSPF